jgi:hypothetical protein
VNGTKGDATGRAEKDVTGAGVDEENGDCDGAARTTGAEGGVGGTSGRKGEEDTGQPPSWGWGRDAGSGALERMMS